MEMRCFVTILKGSAFMALPTCRSFATRAMRAGRRRCGGFLLGWFICPVENYGPEILEANMERLGTAVEDFDTVALIDTL